MEAKLVLNGFFFKAEEESLGTNEDLLPDKLFVYPQPPFPRMKAQFTADFETRGSKGHNGFVKYLVLCGSFCYSDENRLEILSLPLRSLGKKSQL